MSKADLSKQPAQVAAMFDQVSTRYDRTNAVLSVGNAALWRVATTRAVDPQVGESILDVAAGTGTSSASLARNGASVVAADFSAGMIDVGRERQAGNPFIRFVQADATALPFDDDSFDAVTISFGLRNIVDPKKALAEFFRVVKPGGRVVVCEFSQPPLAPVRAGYAAYLKYGMPVLARVASSNPAAYEYLMESIQAWPDQRALAEWMREAGFERVAYRNLTAGIVALHRGFKPLPAELPVSPAPAPAPAPAAEAASSSPAAKPKTTKAASPKAPSATAPKPAASARAKTPATAKPKPASSTPRKPKAAPPKAAPESTGSASTGPARSEDPASTVPPEGE
ncbi:bifunctional demethylmenaquinone methyltransferase/2-methoxy-6-polyprenyl-1,4-benzoquinol methylase UbiE [Leifsonia sp. fls2-241-R2A-40a]|uniref:bifunctional demethylmenaquinone methyltransferase/2-methoxy-6-polyprenyl-1,4-benzoquinol methylase UbiE n=1 Tax=Leifsonia sp. fls2-241-R2A-40a TaxID=3040290 RepID=UPI00254ADBE2|nr:bifunctional demethylmenaquinone methyltransferase/2-methoxy-6-polyprenyl-1,4-benzoquinol methylase UbiE [Leifsonia sp. fls2-241-R2A-40a]